MTIEKNIQEVSLKGYVELYTVDLNPISIATVYNFTNNRGGTITYDGVVYTPLAAKISEPTYEMDGKLPVATMEVFAQDPTIISILDEGGDLKGASLSKKWTQAEFLDGEPGADTTQFKEDTWIIDGVRQSNIRVIKWNLVLGLALDDRVHRNQVIFNG